MKVSKEIKIGGLMILAIGLLFWGANYLKGINIFKDQRTVYAVYSRVDGLSSSNPVVINGHKVGQVETVKFLPDNSGKLLVKFSISEKSLKVPKDTKAKIVSSDLLGSKSIDLQLGASEEFIQNEDTLKSDIEASLSEAVNQQIAPLKSKAEGLINTVDSAIITLSAIFDKDARNDLDASFTSIKNSLESFERTMVTLNSMVDTERENIHKIFVNMESITANLARNNKKLTNVLANIETISDSLAGAELKQTVANASTAMQEFSSAMKKINSGQGSLGQLINNDTLYQNLEKSANDLDQLLLDMRLNPERYVHFSIFGKKKKKE